jgi:hypothetical protein
MEDFGNWISRVTIPQEATPLGESQRLIGRIALFGLLLVSLLNEFLPYSRNRRIRTPGGGSLPFDFPTLTAAWRMWSEKRQGGQHEGYQPV